MNISDEMWRKFKNMRQEILDLKQSKKASCASKYYTFTQGAGGNYYNVWLITYKAGDQPIISEVLSYSNSSLSAPSGNQQYLFTFSQSVSSITILSTREVDSIVGIQ